jgi:hypothetical protein
MAVGSAAGHVLRASGSVGGITGAVAHVRLADARFR